MRFAVPVLLLLAAVDGSALPVLLAAVLLTVAMAVAVAAAAAAPTRSTPVGVPRPTRPRRLPRSLDPDAAGRPRPRAPSFHLA